MTELTFSEEQKFAMKFLFPLGFLFNLVFLGFIIWYSLQEIQLVNPYENHTQSKALLLITNILILAFILVIDWLLYSVKLVTEINKECIRYRFYPFILKTRNIYWEEVEKSYVRKYKPILEYGGWGLRLGIRSKSGALNIKGRYGLQLELKSGRRLLIGTQKPEELESFLNTLGRNRN